MIMPRRNSSTIFWFCLQPHEQAAVQAWHRIVGFPPTGWSGLLWPVKDDIALKTPDRYSVPCVKSFAWDRTFHWEGGQGTPLTHLSPLSINLGYLILLQGTSILAKHPDTWLMRWSRFIPTMWAEKMVCPWASHGSLPFTPWRTK
jgi:hypothetical protein